MATLCPACGHDSHAGRCFGHVLVRRGFQAQCPCTHKTEGTDGDHLLANAGERDPVPGEPVAQRRTASGERGKREPTLGELVHNLEVALDEYTAPPPTFAETVVRSAAREMLPFLKEYSDLDEHDLLKDLGDGGLGSGNWLREW